MYASTERLVLRRFRETDVDAAHAVLGDPACAAFVGGIPLSWAETVDFVERAVAQDPVEDVAVCLRGTGELVGVVRAGGFLHGDDEFGGRELRWVVHRDHWGQGVATEAVSTLMEEVFIDPSVTHVVAYCEREHLRARKVAEKVGMAQDRAMATASAPVAAEVFGTVSLDLREAEPDVRPVSASLIKYSFVRPGARRTFRPT